MNNIQNNIQIDSRYRTWAEIDLAALLHNFNLAKERTGGKPVMCVIKANAYGHGATECGKYLEAHGAAAFAVACLEEAVELREAGIKLPILILGYTASEYTKLLCDYDITQTIVDYNHATELADAAKAINAKLKAHIKIDTGMSRAGLLAQGKENIENTILVASKICELPGLDICGMYTHFSVADTPTQDEYTEWQIDNFNAVCDGLAANGHKIPCCHASNSAAILEHKNAHFDMVREGIMLYGLYPDSVPVENGPLEPVMTLKSRVSQVRALPKETTISYGRTYKASEDMKSAVVLCGYADGYPRRLSNNAYVMIKGNKYPQIGRVCMDMIMINATGSDVSRGDEVTLFGQGGMSTEAVSQIVGTINYELTCVVPQRACRVYINR